MSKIGHKSPTYPTGDFFKKIDCYFCLLHILHHNTIMVRKVHWSRSQNTRQHNFLINWQEAFFWGEIDYSSFCQSIVPLTQNHDIRFCNFTANWDQIAEFSLLEQGIRMSPALVKYLLILSPTTRKNPSFVYCPTKCLPPSTKYQFPCFNPVKTLFSFLAAVTVVVSFLF